MSDNYKEINKESWNQRVGIHLTSDFYNMPEFLKGETSLKEIELPLLGDVSGLKILHLQCHFGQDSLSLARMGAKVTGVDISDEAIKKAKELNAEMGLNAEFVCCDIYDLPDYLEGTYDMVFASYGTIVWLPDMDKWASIVSRYLKPKGTFVFVDFHPILEMYGDDFSKIKYEYFNTKAYAETEDSTYGDTEIAVSLDIVTWNHPLSEVFSALLKNGLSIKDFQEYNYSPYNCFNGMIEVAPSRYRIEAVGRKIPMVYTLKMEKK